LKIYGEIITVAIPKRKKTNKYGLIEAMAFCVIGYDAPHSIAKHRNSKFVPTEYLNFID
jgi:hypothetical protein